MVLEWNCAVRMALEFSAIPHRSLTLSVHQTMTWYSGCGFADLMDVPMQHKAGFLTRNLVGKQASAFPATEGQMDQKTYRRNGSGSQEPCVRQNSLHWCWAYQMMMVEMYVSVRNSKFQCVNGAFRFYLVVHRPPSHLGRDLGISLHWRIAAAPENAHPPYSFLFACFDLRYEGLNLFRRHFLISCNFVLPSQS